MPIFVCSMTYLYHTVLAMQAANQITRQHLICGKHDGMDYEPYIITGTIYQ